MEAMTTAMLERYARKCWTPHAAGGSRLSRAINRDQHADPERRTQGFRQAELDAGLSSL